MIQGKFCLKTHEILQPFANVSPLLSPFYLPSSFGRENEASIEEKEAQEWQSLCGSSSIFRFGPGKINSVPDSAPDLTDPSFLSSPRWLGCYGSFWHLFCKMRFVINHLQMYKGEVLCHYHILLCLIGQAQCLQGSCSKHLKHVFGNRLPSWRWVWKLEHFSSSVSN